MFVLYQGARACKVQEESSQNPIATKTKNCQKFLTVLSWSKYMLSLLARWAGLEHSTFLPVLFFWRIGALGAVHAPGFRLSVNKVCQQEAPRCFNIKHQWRPQVPPLEKVGEENLKGNRLQGANISHLLESEINIIISNYQSYLSWVYGTVEIGPGALWMKANWVWKCDKKKLDKIFWFLESCLRFEKTCILKCPLLLPHKP